MIAAASLAIPLVPLLFPLPYPGPLRVLSFPLSLSRRP